MDSLTLILQLIEEERQFRVRSDEELDAARDFFLTVCADVGIGAARIEEADESVGRNR